MAAVSPRSAARISSVALTGSSTARPLLRLSVLVADTPLVCAAIIVVNHQQKPFAQLNLPWRLKQHIADTPRPLVIERCIMQRVEQPARRYSTRRAAERDQRERIALAALELGCIAHQEEHLTLIEQPHAPAAQLRHS